MVKKIVKVRKGKRSVTVEEVSIEEMVRMIAPRRTKKWCRDEANRIKKELQS